MKLLNQSLKYLSVSIFFIISLWAIIFYFSMLHEIKESVDEGLENYKRQIIYKAEKDTTILSTHNFDEGFYAIEELPQEKALVARDIYVDTSMYMQDADDYELELEPVRMLTTVFENNGRYYELRMINSMVEEDDLVEELLWDVMWLYVILVLGVIVINNVVLKRVWKPFYDFLYQLKNYRLGSAKDLPEVNSKTKEFIDLQNAVNALLKHSIETYEQQKEFIGNASHELQTPLAIATNKLELLVENENLGIDQAQTIAEIMNILERLVKLNKSLLHLTKIENKQFLDNQLISLNKTVRQSVEDLSEIAEFKEVKVSVHEAEKLIIEMDSSLANSAISNLMRNAIFHTTQNGVVTINISKNALIITNTGKAQSLSTEKLFTRFYKSENEQSGTGLGLAIVKAICDLYGFTVSYRFENSKHCFELNFLPNKA